MKEKLTKLFGGINMTWLKVIIFAVAAGIYTGLINQVSVLENTSLRDIAVTYECWVFFAVIIAFNCKKAWESAIKVFVFFAISQPMVFLVEIPSIGTDSALSYLKRWLIPILLTLPGGFIAFYAKKDNILGALILTVANALLGCHAVYYIFQTIGSFPHHLLTIIFCIAQICVYTAVIIKKGKFRILSIVITIVAMACLALFSTNQTAEASYPLPEGESWNCVQQNDHGEVEVYDGGFSYTCNSFDRKDNTLTFTNDKGEEIIIYVYFDDGGNLQFAQEEGSN